MSIFPFVSIIAEIEDALIATIKGADFGYALGTVASDGGELLSDDDAMALLLKKFPAVWVSFTSEHEPVSFKLSKDNWLVEATFLVLVATRSARGERFTRHSASSVEVGAYQIISDLRLLFLNQDLGLPIQAFRPGAVKTLSSKKIAGQTMAAFAVELKCKYVLGQRECDSTPDLLVVNFGLHLNPTAQSAPEVSGIITLEGL